VCKRCVLVAGFTTTTLPSTTPGGTCRNPEDCADCDYDKSDYCTLQYPVNGSQVLKGSGAELSLPADQPQKVVLSTESVEFVDLGISVRHAANVTLKLTLKNLTTITAQRSAAKDAVSSVLVERDCSEISL